MTLAALLLGFVVVQRVAELLVAASNTRRLRARGAIEIDAAGYPWIVALHTAWLAALLASVPSAVTSWPWLSVFVALQFGRLWVITTLDRRWTTRIIVLPGAPLVQSGPYRYFRHPNYAIVVIEIVALPLAFGAVWIAVIFGALNALLLARRIIIENRALGLA